MQTAFKVFFLFFMFSANLWATNISDWYTQQADKKIQIQVDFFLSSTCTHCHKADAFFLEIEKNTPWLHITRYIINEDKNALIHFNQLLSGQQLNDFAVPSVFFCNSRWLGFASAETTGKDLIHAMNYCKQQIEKKGTLDEATVNTLRHWGNANMFDSGMIENPSPVHYLFTIALIDAFNPCAFFCLAAFFAFLFIQETQRGRLINGSLFILAVGIAHYFQQVHSSTFFEILFWLRIPAALVALLILYAVAHYYRKNTRPNFFLFLPFAFALMVQLYQQTCMMNWAYIFEQWLHNKQFSGGQAILYQLAYQVVYVLPLLITLILYQFLTERKWFVSRQPQLKIIGLLFITAFSLILLIYPLALAYLLLSLALIFVLSIGGWFLSSYINKKSSME